MDPSSSGDQLSPALEEIRSRAYQIYCERGRADGRDLEDWLQAEKELTDISRRRNSA